MADSLDFIVADLNKFVRGEIVALGLNVNANLRDGPPLGTPIDTGWASAGWVPSLGAPFIDPSPEAPKDDSPARVASRRAAAEQGVNSIIGWDFNNGSIFSSNSTPYIGALNAGSSPQSPSGFVTVAVERAVRQTEARATTQGNRNRRAAAARSGRRR